MSIIDHAEFLDVRTLAGLASDAYEVITSEGEKDGGEVADAEQVLRVLGAALVSLDKNIYFPLTEEDFNAINSEDEDAPKFVYGEDIAELWEEMGDNIHVTLIAENYIEDYLEDVAKEFGWITDETPDFVINAIDWDSVANTMKTNSEGGEITLDGKTYWIGL